MKISQFRTASSGILILALAALVVVLAVLQYRWIGQVAEATAERMKSHLDSSVESFQRDFGRELMDICGAFRWDSRMDGALDWNHYARQLEDWRAQTSHPELIAGLYIEEPKQDGEAESVRFDDQANEFRPVPAGRELEVEALECSAVAIPDPGGGERRGGFPFWSFAVSDGKPLLFRPMYDPPVFIRRGFSAPRQHFGHLIVELDAAFLSRVFLPELTRRSFGAAGEQDFQVAIFGPAYGGAFYLSNGSTDSGDIHPPDVVVDLLMIPPPTAFLASSRSPSRDSRMRTPPWSGRSPGIPVVPCRSEDQWKLAVNHRAGSIGEAVEVMRLQNLLASGGVLILLALSIVMLIVYTRRAQKLAKLQMEFAAGVSHELRTPLAVISLTSDNLAAGAVESFEQMQQYGRLIKGEGRKLTTIVENALQYTAGQIRGQRFLMRPVKVEDVVNRALCAVAPVAEELDMTVEVSMNGSLPEVMADADALSRCVVNLVTNAVKYGGEDRRVVVDARASDTSGNTYVDISVIDSGRGIAKDDLPHIFEPFYQGKTRNHAKSPGVGLGLSLVKETIEAMGGEISVESAPGRGARFTLRVRQST